MKTNHIKKGYYTCDICETYWLVIPMSYNKEYTNAKIVHYYKNGVNKDKELDVKRFKLYNKNITHWKEYNCD